MVILRLSGTSDKVVVELNLYNILVPSVLSFGAESFVFQVAIQKFKDQDI